MIITKIDIQYLLAVPDALRNPQHIIYDALFFFLFTYLDTRKKYFWNFGEGKAARHCRLSSTVTNNVIVSRSVLKSSNDKIMKKFKKNVYRTERYNGVVIRRHRATRVHTLKRRFVGGPLLLLLDRPCVFSTRRRESYATQSASNPVAAATVSGWAAEILFN